MGATLYHCLLGVSPAHATDRAFAVEQGNTDPVAAGLDRLSSAYSHALREVVEWMMQPRAADRPRQAGDVLNILMPNRARGPSAIRGPAQGAPGTFEAPRTVEGPQVLDGSAHRGRYRLAAARHAWTTLVEARDHDAGTCRRGSGLPGRTSQCAQCGPAPIACPAPLARAAARPSWRWRVCRAPPGRARGGPHRARQVARSHRANAHQARPGTMHQRARAVRDAGAGARGAGRTRRIPCRVQRRLENRGARRHSGDERTATGQPLRAVVRQAARKNVGEARYAVERSPE